MQNAAVEAGLLRWSRRVLPQPTHPVQPPTQHLGVEEGAPRDFLAPSQGEKGVEALKAREAQSKGIGIEEVGQERRAKCSPAKRDGNKGGKGQRDRILEESKRGKRFPAPPSQSDGSGQKKRGRWETTTHFSAFRSSLDRRQVERGLEKSRPLPSWVSHVAFQDQSIPGLPHSPPGKRDKCNFPLSNFLSVFLTGLLGLLGKQSDIWVFRDFRDSLK